MGSSVFRMDINEYSKAVAEKVDHLREVAKFSKKGLAESSGIPITTLGRRLDGTDPFNMRELKAVAEVLGTSAAELSTIYDTKKKAVA